MRVTMNTSIKFKNFRTTFFKTSLYPHDEHVLFHLSLNVVSKILKPNQVWWSRSRWLVELVALQHIFVLLPNVFVCLRNQDVDVFFVRYKSVAVIGDLHLSCITVLHLGTKFSTNPCEN